MNETTKVSRVTIDDLTILEPVLPFNGQQVELSDVTQDDPAIPFLEYVIDEWKRSKKYADMLTAERYLRNRNDILDRKRTVIGSGGQEIEVNNLANNRLAHPFLRKLVKQKVNYLLSNPPIISSENLDLQEGMQALLTKGFLRDLKNTSVNAIAQGIGWFQAYYDEEGTLRFKRIPASEIIPFWADIDHTKLIAALRVYNYTRFDQATPTIIERVQYFTRKGVFNYEREYGASLALSVTNPVDSNYETLTSLAVEGPSEELDENLNGTQVEEHMWERIPLIPVKYNQEEQSLLDQVKPLIDAYDRRSSDVANALEEEPDKIKIIKDYDGTNKEEFIQNLAVYRMVFLRDTGSVTTLDTSIDLTAELANLDRLRKDIYEFGQGIDTQERDLGNASGVALKFVYSDLDLDCSGFGDELSWAFEQMAWFVAEDLKLRNAVGGVDFEDLTITYNTSIMINEKEQIESVKNSEGVVSQKTLIAHHPYVQDVEVEMVQLDEEAKRLVDAELEQAKQLQGLNPLTGTPVSEDLAPLVEDEEVVEEETLF